VVAESPEDSRAAPTRQLRATWLSSLLRNGADGAAGAGNVERVAGAEVSFLAEDEGLLVESSTAPTRQVLAALLSSLRDTGAVRCAAAEEVVGTDACTVDFPIMDGELLVDGAVVGVESMTGPTRNMVCASFRLLLIA
jgi:hypothetical protein